MMKPTQTSTLPDAHKSLTSLQRNLAYFSTSQKRDYPNHALKSRTHSLRALHDRVNFKDHCTNKVRFHLPKQYPMYKVNDVHERSQYPSKPLDGGFLDRELREVFKENNRSGGELGAGRKLNSETTHGRFFHRHTKDGRGESCKPAIEKHVGNEKLMEIESISRVHYPAFDKDLARRFRGEFCSLEPGCAATNLPLVPTLSQHRLDFSEEQLGFQRSSEYPGIWKPGLFDAV